MIDIRRSLCAFVGAALCAFAAPAIADSGDYFRLAVPPSASGGAQANFTITITNKAAFDYLKSFTITAPAGVTISSVQSASSYVPASKISATSTGISVSGIAIPYGKSGAVKMTATFPPAACADTPYTWGATAKGGLIVNNEVFTLDTANSTIVTTVPKGCFTVTPSSSGNGSISPSPAQSVLPNGTAQFTLTPNALFSVGTVTGTCGGTLAGNVFTTAAVTANCTVIGNFVPNVLSITSAPTSVALATPFDVTVGINPGPATVTANTTACGNAAVSTKSSSQTSITFTLTIPGTATSLTTCGLTFAADNYTPPPVLNLTVFQASASACSPPDATDPTSGSAFDVSAVCSSGIGVNVSGFAAGFRSFNKGMTCPALNFTLTNNICGPGPTQDASGKTIPTNAISLVWDSSQRAAFTYTVTWKAEYVNPATGVPFAQRTKYCIGTSLSAPCGDINDPNDPNRVPLKACTSPDVAFSSIPTGDLACLKEEDWVTVPQSECAGLPLPTGATGTPACIRATTIHIDAVDPPMIRG